VFIERRFQKDGEGAVIFSCKLLLFGLAIDEAEEETGKPIVEDSLRTASEALLPPQSCVG